MGKKLSLVALAAVLVFATVAVAAGPSPNAKATRVDGVIDAIDLDAQQLLVCDVTVQVTPNTVIWIGDAEAILADLAVGDTVVVCGVLDDAGVLFAHHINVKYVGQ